ATPPRTDDEDDDEEEDDDEDDSSTRATSAPAGVRRLPPGIATDSADEHRHCELFQEPEDAEPAFDAGRGYPASVYPSALRALRVQPTWALSNAKNTLALRVTVGRGTVTGLSSWLPLNSRDLIAGDNALILAAVFDLPAHRPLWLVESETREPLVV